jgi:hypothetical protein
MPRETTSSDVSHATQNGQVTHPILAHAAFVGLVFVKLLIPLALQSPLTVRLSIDAWPPQTICSTNLYIDGLQLYLFFFAEAQIMRPL